MNLEDLIIAFAEIGNDAVIVNGLNSFKRLADGTWAFGLFDSNTIAEFTLCDNPNDKKEFIKELLSSDCDIPDLVRSKLNALLYVA